jgi:hypothetical protein
MSQSHNQSIFLRGDFSKVSSRFKQQFLLKGIGSRKFGTDILFLVLFESLEVSTPFLFYPFFKISSFFHVHRIFEYARFSGEFLLSHKTVNELCYVAGFVNNIVT